MEGKIGVIYSPGYGVGWSTNGNPNSALDQELANAISNNVPMSVIFRIAEINWPQQPVWGLQTAIVRWVDKGTPFKIEVHDGNEQYVSVYGIQVAL